MTGFGQASADLPGARVTVEARSVNNRFADLRLRLPGAWSELEPDARRRVLSRVKRGRVEVDCRVQRQPGAVGAVELDRDVVEGVLAAGRALASDFGLPGVLDVPTVIRIPGVVRVASGDDALGDDAREVVGGTLDRALEALDADRRREGGRLATDLLERLSRMEGLAEAIRERAGEVPAAARRKLEERLTALGAGVDLDPVRLAQEVVFLADRSDVTEETVRLRGHLEQARRLLSSPDGDPVGKRLDFLVQEIHRETNTVCSKSSDLELSRRALDLKAETEKVREQVQNLE